MKNQNQKQNMVSLAGAAGNAPRKKNDKKRWIILLSALAVLIVVIVIYLISQSRPSGPSLPSREFVEYTYTADDLCDDVSYYALGLTGEQDADAMQSVSMLCFNRQDKSLSLLQVPVSMYIEKGTDFAASTVGAVWSNPLADTWCNTCRCRVTADEREGDKHTVCGTKVQTRVGSSTKDFARIFNTQFGLPVDNYLVISPDGLATLIDQMGGVTLAVEKAFSYDGKDYKAGTTVLPGNAAVHYVTQWNYDGSVKSDFARMQRQRQLWAALLTRLSGYRVDELHNTDPKRVDVLTAVMSGSDPIRFDSTSFGKSRLLGKANDSATDNTRYTMAMAQFLHSLGRVPLDKVTCSILPGESVKKGSATVFTAYKSNTISLLNTQMNPQGLTLDTTTVGLTELAHTEQADTYTATLDGLFIEQTATVETEE